MARQPTTLIQLRNLIRAGRASAADKMLRGINNGSASLDVEKALLSLLRFEEQGEVEAFLGGIDLKTLDSASRCRWCMGRGICANRLRDPVGALSWLNQGLALARNTSDPAGLGELILERARVHSWMGSFARAHEDLAEALLLSSDAPSLRLAVLLRYADMYAEAERWPQAERFIARGMPLAEKLSGSVQAWQLHDCAIRVGQAQERPAAKSIAALEKDVNLLPDYLRFRLAVAETRGALARRQADEAQGFLEKLRRQTADMASDSYERAVATGLEGEEALLRGDSAKALPLLAEAGGWFESRDLAVPRLKLALLEADALMALARPDDAARLLGRLRDYCGKRGLQLQREAIDLAQQRHGLPRMAEIEQGRVASANAWNAARAYVIQGQLGQGGQGTVFRAHDTARDRPVAFKKLALPPGGEAFRALQHEVAALCRAQVTGVARIIACGTAEDGMAYLVQELVAGQNLRIGLPPDTAVRVALLAKLAATLDALHAHDLAHGDIKPENVIVDVSGLPVLVDFSAARFAGLGNSQNAATRAYLPWGWRARFMSPLHRDQFAFGLMLLEALTDTGPHQRVEWQAGTDARPTLEWAARAARTHPKSLPLLRQLLQPAPFGKPKPLYAGMAKLMT